MSIIRVWVRLWFYAPIIKAKYFVDMRTSHGLLISIYWLVHLNWVMQFRWVAAKQMQTNVINIRVDIKRCNIVVPYLSGSWQKVADSNSIIFDFQFHVRHIMSLESEHCMRYICIYIIAYQVELGQLTCHLIFSVKFLRLFVIALWILHPQSNVF